MDKEQSWGALAAAIAGLGVALWRVLEPKRFGFFGWLGVGFALSTAAYQVGYYLAKTVEGEEHGGDLEDNANDLGQAPTMG